MGTKQIYFVGTGEPFLHPQIFDLIAAAKKSGFELIVYTNGLPLDKDVIGKLIDLRLDVLRVSLWATSPEKFVQQVDQISADLFYRIIENMTSLSRIKKELGVQHPFLELCQTITHQNLDDLNDTVAVARKTACDKMCFSPIVDFAEEELVPFVPDAAETEKIRNNLTDIKKRLDDLSIVHNIDTMLLHYRIDGKIFKSLPCYPAWYFSYFRSDGRVFACQRNTYETTPLGDLQTARFRDIWNNDSYRAFRSTASTCEGLSSITEYYCDYCSHSFNSERVHRHFRFLSPIHGIALAVQNIFK
jgi:MoaA/NifB/PqqE/SkfB family radical SAM enzyme